MSAIIPKKSAGILLYRIVNEELQVFLVHMGGPYWVKKDRHAWSIPKGEFSESEDPRSAALREFAEETGIKLDVDIEELMTLTPIRQAGGKVVHAWAAKSDVDAEHVESNTFSMEWPPNSGRHQEFPEVDKAAWFDLSTAKEKMIKAQGQLLDELLAKLAMEY